MADETRIWTCIPVADFNVPLPPAGDAARGNLLWIWKLLHDAFQRPEKNPLKEARQWDRLPAEVLGSVAPDLDWQSAATGLAAALGDDWFEQRQPDQPVHTLVGPPGCDNGQLLRLLAKQRHFKVYTAPSAETILACSPAEMPDLADACGGDEVLVIPNLERSFLRHADGLNLVRELIEGLSMRRQRVLVGCDSWAWAFLQQVVGIEDLLGAPWTWAPFDAERLDAWLRSVLDLRGHAFRHNEKGELVFPEMDDSDDESGERPRLGNSSLVRSLAAQSRGNPAVARALWRDSLRAQPEDSTETTSSENPAESVIWVASPEQSDARLPIDVDRESRFILHAILLHGGLPLPLLRTLLPFSLDLIKRRVSLMLRAGILEQHDGGLRVSLTAYPLVRQDLVAENFLTDAF